MIISLRRFSFVPSTSNSIRFCLASSTCSCYIGHRVPELFCYVRGTLYLVCHYAHSTMVCQRPLRKKNPARRITSWSREKKKKSIILHHCLLIGVSYSPLTYLQWHAPSCCQCAISSHLPFIRVCSYKFGTNSACGLRAFLQRFTSVAYAQQDGPNVTRDAGAWCGVFCFPVRVMYNVNKRPVFTGRWISDRWHWHFLI